ncbi:MAG: hypothetical protein R3F39_17625 [Myxococcota bacterium]
MLSLLALACVPLGAGCEGFFRKKIEDKLPLFDIPDSLSELPDVDLLGELGVGEACVLSTSQTSDCRVGLACANGTCKALGTSGVNLPCILSDECVDGLYCSVTGTCQPAGSGALNAPCASGGECGEGLYCRMLGLSGVCTATGQNDLGGVCADQGDCLGGLICGADGLCAVGGIVFGLKPWPGVTCSAEDAGPPRVYFEVPDAEPSADFFRLPFPNDIRMSGGRLSLSGFPTPGPGVVGFDPVARIVAAAEQVQRGFSRVPVTFFRFSHAPEFSSVEGNPNAASGKPVTLRYVNIDPDSPSFGAGQSFGWTTTDGGGRYICPRFVEVRVPWEAPLLEGTTYAVLLTRGIRTNEGVEMQPDDDFVAMMSDTRPSAAALAAAWDAYAPLRAWLDGEQIPRSSILAAAVFTTQVTSAPMPAIRTAVRAAPAPTPESMTLCKEGVTSPCDDGLSGDAHVRGCFVTVGDFDEVHLRLDLPVVQKGTRPYLEPADGGGLVTTDAGAVTLQGAESVCVALTVPKGGSMPAAGWPIVIYGHGTGGTFRSGAASVGGLLAAVPVGGAVQRFATLGWDGPMHGERRGLDLDPEPLYFNVGNPVAARGNAWQGAADVFALVRAIGAIDLTPAKSPTGKALRFDPAHVAYLGHSQGAQYGPLVVPYEPGIGALALSGAGAGLVRATLDKTNPVDGRLGIGIALQEFTDQGVRDVRESHPALTLLQGLFDAVDPLDHAQHVQSRPPEGAVPRHVLHIYGQGDTYTPPAAGDLLVRTLKIPVAHTGAGSPPRAIGGTEVLPTPVSANLQSGKVTGAAVEVSPASGAEGHFVLFDDAGVREQLRQFLGTWVATGTPVVVSRPAN